MLKNRLQIIPIWVERGIDSREFTFRNLTLIKTLRSRNSNLLQKFLVSHSVILVKCYKHFYHFIFCFFVILYLL